MKKLIYILSLGVLFSCGGSDTEDNTKPTEESTGESTAANGAINVWIKGNIAGGVNQPIVLEVAGEQGTLKLASGIVAQDGSFALQGNVKGLGMYQMRLGIAENKVIPLTLSPGDKVDLQASYDEFETKPVFSGTKWAASLTTYMSKFNDFALQQMELSKRTDLTQEQQVSAFLKMRKPLDRYACDQIMKDPSNPASLVLMTSLTPVMGYENWNAKYLEALKMVASSYAKTYKESPISASIKAQVDEIEAGMVAFKESSSGTKSAPEINLTNPDGKMMKLSSLKGNIVLVDFWASWCRPCRAENPNVVRLYKQYKSKGFTVFSVSLDEDATAWKRAIEADGLIWPNHVSDLKGWQTPYTGIYGFNSIPYTVLLNRQGKIIGVNLRGEKLEQKLKEIL